MLSDEQRIDIAKDYLKFLTYCFHRSNKNFVVNWHHIEIAKALHRVLAGLSKRLLITMPPRYSKTEMVVVGFIAWVIGLLPDSEFIHTSYSKRLAAKNTYNSRALVLSEGYQEVFPEVKLMYDSKAKDEWRTTDGGVVYASGSEGTITGYGAGKTRDGFGGAILIDDPHKAAEAESAVARQNVIDWYESTVESRLNHPDTPIIVIMQRLHEEDLAGWLLAGKSGEEWDHLSIPAISEEGEALWPFKHDIDKLKQMEVTNPYWFSGQYMQNPVPRSGGMIKREWPKRYKTLPVEIYKVTQSWDTAFKEKQINDPSVGGTWIETNHGHFLVDNHVMRGDYPSVKRAVNSKYQWALEQFNMPVSVLIEDKASGQSLIQELRQESSMPIIAINPTTDKVTRMSTASVHFEAGRVYLPESAPWLPEYESELFLFPLSKHDDQVDQTSQYLNWVSTKREILIG